MIHSHRTLLVAVAFAFVAATARAASGDKAAREAANREWKSVVDARDTNPGKNTNDWFALAQGRAVLKNGGSVRGMPKGVKYGEKECYAKAVIANPHPDLPRNFAYARAWARLGSMGGDTVNGEAYSPEECLIKALKISPESPTAWLELGRLGGASVNGVAHSVVQCYLKAVAATPSVETATAWLELSALGGAKLAGVAHDAKDCVINALAHNKHLATAVARLIDGGVSEKELLRVKNHAAFLARAFQMLGDTGGGTIFAKTYSVYQCEIAVQRCKEFAQSV
jgi:hypothetical protein